jgi:hypothetical protein
LRSNQLANEENEKMTQKQQSFKEEPIKKDGGFFESY